MFDIRRISNSRWWHKKKNWIIFGFFLVCPHTHKVIKHLFTSPVIESEGSDSLLLGCHVHLHGVEEDEDVIELYQGILVSVQQRKQLLVPVSAANRLIGEVVQSRRRPLLGPSPG